MTKVSKVLTGLVLSSLLATGLYASCNNKKSHEMMNQNNGMKMMRKSSHHGKMMFKSILKDLNLSADQKTQIQKIVKTSKSKRQGMNDAFSKSSFDQNKFVKIMSEKRDNMIKSKAEMISKIHAVLNEKQKEQFKVLLDLRAEKMQSRYNKG